LKLEYNALDFEGVQRFIDVQINKFTRETCQVFET